MPSNATRGPCNTAFAMRQKPNLQPAERSDREWWNKRSVRIKKTEAANWEIESNRIGGTRLRTQWAECNGRPLSGQKAQQGALLGYRAKGRSRTPSWGTCLERRMERAGKIGAMKSVSAANQHCRSTQHVSAAAPNRRAYPRRTAPIRLKPQWFERIPHAFSPRIRRP